MKLKLCRCFQRRKRSKGPDAPWTGIGLFEPTATPASASSGAQGALCASSAKSAGSHGSARTAEFQSGGSSGSGAGPSSSSRAPATNNVALRARLSNVPMPMLGQNAPGEPPASAESCLNLEEIKRLREAVPPGNYAVELHRMDPKERYGIQWDPSQLERNNVRVVSKVIPGSLADEWNKSSVLGCDIRVGDELVKVNGKAGRLEIMTAQLTKQRVLLEFRPREPRLADGMGEPAEEPPSFPRDAPGSGPTPSVSHKTFSPNALDEVRLDIQSPSACQDQQGVESFEQALAAVASLVPPSSESPAGVDAPEETAGAPGEQVASAAVESRHEGSGTVGVTVEAPRGTGEDGRNQPGEPEQEVEKPQGTSIEDRLQQLLHHNYGLPAPEHPPEQEKTNAQEQAEVVKPSLAASSKVPTETEAQSIEPEPEMPAAQADSSSAPLPPPSETQAEAPMPQLASVNVDSLPLASSVTKLMQAAPAPPADAGHVHDGSAPELVASPELPEETQVMPEECSPEENAAPVPPEAMQEAQAPAMSADAGQVEEIGLVQEAEPVPATPESPKDPFLEQAPLTGRRDGDDSGLPPPAPPASDQRM